MITAILVTDENQEYTVQVSPLTYVGDKGAYVTLDDKVVKGLIVYVNEVEDEGK